MKTEIVRLLFNALILAAVATVAACANNGGVPYWLHVYDAPQAKKDACLKVAESAYIASSGDHSAKVLRMGEAWDKCMGAK